MQVGYFISFIPFILFAFCKEFNRIKLKYSGATENDKYFKISI